MKHEVLELEYEYDALEPHIDEKTMKRINEFLSQEKKLKIKDLAINGYDVMEVLGISESPLVGKILKEIYALVLSGKIPNERTALLEKLNDYSVKISSK